MHAMRRARRHGSPRTILDRLGEVALFAGCDRDELELVDTLVTEVQVPTGHLLMGRGDLGTQFLVIADGYVEVELPSERVVLGPGDFVGELALLDGAPRTAGVRALTDVRIYATAAHEFHRLLTIPSIAWRIHATAGARRARGGTLVRPVSETVTSHS